MAVPERARCVLIRTASPAHNDVMTIARIFGVPVRVDWSWLLVFTLFVAMLAESAGPFGPLSAPARLALAAITVLVLFGCVLVHEAAHASVARRYGIGTKEIVLFAFGGVSQLESTGSTPGQQALIAAAGPVASIALALVFVAIALLVPAGGAAYHALSYLSTINIVLAVFNLLPCNPLDGGRMVNAATWAITGNRERAARSTARVSMVVGSLMLAGGLLLFFTGYIANGIWVSFLAWFILRAAGAEWSSELLKASLSPETCADMMDSPGEALEPDVTCAYALQQMISARHRTMPIASGGNLIGLVSLSDFAKIGNRNPGELYVTAIMTPAANLLTVAPETSALDAFKSLTASRYHQIPVVNGKGHLQGFISRDTVLRALTFVNEQRANVPDSVMHFVEKSSRIGQ